MPWTFESSLPDHFMKYITLLLLLVASALAQRIPDGTLYYGNKEYRIIELPAEQLEAPDCGPYKVELCMATTDCKHLTISFADNETLKEEQGSFLHELMHVVTNCKQILETTHQFIYDTSDEVTKVLTDSRNHKYAKWYIGN